MMKFVVSMTNESYEFDSFPLARKAYNAFRIAKAENLSLKAHMSDCTLVWNSSVGAFFPTYSEK